MHFHPAHIMKRTALDRLFWRFFESLILVFIFNWVIRIPLLANQVDITHIVPGYLTPRRWGLVHDWV